MTHIPLTAEWKVKADVNWFDKFIIKEGFITDLASIPRALWGIFPRDGNYIECAVAHDYCYRNMACSMSRDEADDLFLYSMKKYGVGWITRNAIYSGVYMFGGSYWEKCNHKAHNET